MTPQEVTNDRAQLMAEDHVTQTDQIAAGSRVACRWACCLGDQVALAAALP